MKVIIADDESIVLEGLKCIIDWEALGFSICALTRNGVETLEKILTLEPDLVLLDIRMPKLSGTELVQQAREQGFRGHFIILSGYSDFSYAQTAIRCGVDFYLTKPIDEDELESAVRAVKKQIEEEQRSAKTLSHYRENARFTILQNLLTGNFRTIHELSLQDFDLTADAYQVVLYESFARDPFQPNYDLAELLRVTNYDSASFDHITMDNREVLLLKGTSTLSRFVRLLSHYEVHPQKGSPLDSLFLACGRPVSVPEDILFSYFDSAALMERRFFCSHNQHVLSFHSLPTDQELTWHLTDETAGSYAASLLAAIQTQNYRGIQTTLQELEKDLYYCTEDPSMIRRFLIDVYLQVRQKLSSLYASIDLPFLTNSAVIDSIDSKYYLYEILHMLREQFEMYTNAIASPSSATILDDILHYINHNYQENLKLETIAPLFGYNSAYLGKLFTKKVGESFNSYLDRIRIEQSMLLLKNPELKVYEVAERVGYKNVDYFHKKFRKYCQISPAEFRKNL